MVPHFAEELWQALGYEDSLQLQPWPEAQPEALVESVFTLVVQVDGKVRSRIEAPVSATEEQLKQLGPSGPVGAKVAQGGTPAGGSGPGQADQHRHLSSLPCLINQRHSA